jgi:hypothetical protein
VNRFPALEARGVRDKAVKAAVLDAAWWMAFRAGGMPGLGKMVSFRFRLSPLI